MILIYCWNAFGTKDSLLSSQLHFDLTLSPPCKVLKAGPPQQALVILVAWKLCKSETIIKSMRAVMVCFCFLFNSWNLVAFSVCYKLFWFETAETQIERYPWFKKNEGEMQYLNIISADTYGLYMSIKVGDLLKFIFLYVDTPN